MNAIVQFVVKHGYSVLFASVFARQICLPVPAILFLLAAGALAGSGRLSFAVVLLLAIIACLLADMVWYEAGRLWGDRIFHFIYGLALDPDAAARRSKKTFARYGPHTLIVAKFVLGLDAATPPLAGLSGTTRLRFIAFDAAGAALWSGAYAGLGYAFSKDMDRAAAYVARLGTLLALVALAGLAIYVGCKVVRWRRFMAEFRMARITPEELQQKLEAGEKVFIVELHGRRGGRQDHPRIPGAVCMNSNRLPRDREEIPRDREVVVYCAAPHELTSARVALALQRRGFERVRPLAGGLRAWQERGFPLTSLTLPCLEVAAAPLPEVRFRSLDSRQLSGLISTSVATSDAELSPSAMDSRIC
ncbi:MAG TPA: rhodanese-like domain-containing protein [Terriglobales bacterium]|nr:rhodanese-like domain-containing protein [Terriglobales bacterium]